MQLSGITVSVSGKTKAQDAKQARTPNGETATNAAETSGATEPADVPSKPEASTAHISSPAEVPEPEKGASLEGDVTPKVRASADAAPEARPEGSTSRPIEAPGLFARVGRFLWTDLEGNP